VHDQATRATPRQLEVLRLVLGQVRIRGIARAIGASSTNAAVDHLLALSRKGLIERTGEFGCTTPWKVTEAGLRQLGLRRCGCCQGAGVLRLV
jgi:SOS-response transcriptional repressor LexA